MTNQTINQKIERILKFLESKEKPETETERQIQETEFQADLIKKRRINIRNKPLIKCPCCMAIVPAYSPNQIYCNACNVHHKDLVGKLNNAKTKLRDMNRLIYGTNKGNERIRRTKFSNLTSPAIQLSYNNGYKNGFRDGFEAGKKNGNV